MRVVLYWLGTQAYFLAIRIAALFNQKAGLAIKGRKNLLHIVSTRLSKEKRKRIWMHCASLGEFEQGRPVLEALRQEYPEYALILTFFSPSGYEVRKGFDGVDYVFYLPFDSPAKSRKFVQAVNPSIAIIVKYEYWYFLLKTLKKKQVPVMLIAALFHREQPFFKWYGGLHRKMLRMFSHMFVQDVLSGQQLAGLGIENVTVAGDPRFDRVLNIARQASELPIAETFCKGHKVLVAGSTWPADEELLAQTLQHLPPNWKLILVPHEVNETHIHALRKQFGTAAILWSQWSNNENEAKVLIVDTMGLLSQLYRYGTVAYIGGGFGKEGIHNILEAAVYGIPCIHGPVFHQFLEAEALLSAGGSNIVTSAAELTQQLQVWNTNAGAYQTAASAAKNYVLQNAGATERIVDYLRVKKSLSSL